MKPFGDRVRFTLAPVSVYEGKGGGMEKATKAEDMAALMELGVDLRQLMARPRGSGAHEWWDVPLAEWFHKLAVRFGRQK